MFKFQTESVAFETRDICSQFKCVRLKRRQYQKSLPWEKTTRLFHQFVFNINTLVFRFRFWLVPSYIFP